jgi:hypothetical protein
VTHLDDDRPLPAPDPDDRPPSIPPDVPEADALDQLRAVPLDEEAEDRDREDRQEGTA